MTLMDIKKIQIPKGILEYTFNILRKYGEKKLESHVIWVGKDDTDVFHVIDVWFPKQYNSPISYKVPEKEIHRINVKLNELKLTAIAQVHTHPNFAFHSFTDDYWPTLVLPGSFSVVIPNYGYIEENNLNDWAIYRFDGVKWLQFSNIGGIDLFQVVQH